MKKILLFLIISNVAQIYSDFGAFSPGGYGQIGGPTIRGGGSASTNPAAGPSNCTPGPCNPDPATTALPPLMINLYNSTSTTTPISTILFPTNQTQGSGGFYVNSAILTVHIFPPSNIITGPSIINTPTGTQNSYAIMYTLKSLGGHTFQKVLQYANTSANPPTTVMPILKNIPTIPTAISISSLTVPAGTTVSSLSPNQISALPQTSALSVTNFLPNFTSTTSAGTQQRILNAISPLSQKFLISATNGTINSITPISGTVDTEDGSSLVTSFSGQSSSISPTTGGSAQPIQVTLTATSGHQVIFENSKFNFTTEDLANGLALNVHIFPPTSSSSSPDYFAFATLRTLDGLKLHKIPFASFSGMPTQLSVTYGSAAISNSTPQFSTLFVNSALSSNSNTQAFNLISPINLRCLLQSNSSGIVTVSMM